MKGREDSGAEADGRRLRVRELLHDPGVQHRVSGTLRVEAGGLTSARLDDDADATYELTLEAQANRIRVTGSTRGSWVGECRRCLEPTSGEVVATVAEIFETLPTLGETWPIEDGLIDLEPAIREALLLELPLAPLCAHDCDGPDPDRYPTANPVEDGHDRDGREHAPLRDPRWAALDGLDLEGH